MSLQHEFTPEQIQALVSGETVSFAKASTDVPAPPVEETPLTPASSFKPRSSVSLSSTSNVGPRIKDTQGGYVSDGSKLKGPSSNAFARLDEERIKLEADKKAFAEAQSQLKELSNPAQLLNQLNGLRRIVDKLQKEVNTLKKANKDT